MTWWLGLDRIVQRVIIGGALVCAIIALSLLVGYCSSREEVAKARAGGTLADARANAGQDANDTRDTVEGKIDTINDNVKAGTDAIRNAPDDASRNDAALRSLCRVDPSASPDCRMLQPRP